MVKRQKAKVVLKHRHTGKHSRHHNCSTAGQRSSVEGLEEQADHNITALITWVKEEWRKEVADIPSSEIGNNLCSSTLTLVLL